MKIRGYSQPGLVTTGMGGNKKKRSAPKHRIILSQDRHGWTWSYFVGSAHRASAPRNWPKLSDASRSANAFRKELAAFDLCEIVPPPGHKYSGD